MFNTDIIKPSYGALVALVLSLTIAYAEEPEEIDWSDPEVVAYMQPEVLCPFTIEFYPRLFYMNGVSILKLNFHNTLKYDAYALAEEDFDFLCRSELIKFWARRQRRNLTLKFPPLDPNERNLGLWRKLAPGESLAMYYPFEISNGEFVSTASAERLEVDIRDVTGYTMSLRNQNPAYRVSMFGALIVDGVAPDVDEKTSVQRTKLETIDLTKTEQNADGETVCPNAEVLKAGLDAISDETNREGLRAYFYNKSNDVVRKTLTRFPKRVGKDRADDDPGTYKVIETSSFQR